MGVLFLLTACSRPINSASNTEPAAQPPGGPAITDSSSQSAGSTKSSVSPASTEKTTTSTAAAASAETSAISTTVAVTAAETTATDAAAVTSADSAPAGAAIHTPNAAPKELPDNEALLFAANMKVGWNLGNTLDCTGSGVGLSGGESAWGNPKTTPEMIAKVREAGFNTIRIPVSWHDHVDADFNINNAWMDRVAEIVGYAMNENMYVILNIHHDDDVRFMYPDSAHYENSSKYMKAIWRQISERFKDKGDSLIFEGVNEPRLIGAAHEWDLQNDPVLYKDAAETLNKLNQDFVDTVRASGGNNADRYLMVPGICASPESALDSAFKLPVDTASNHIIVSVHAYRPWNFAMAAVGDPSCVETFDMTKSGSTGEISGIMDKLYDKFIKNCVPVIIGEYGVINKNNNTAARVEYHSYYIDYARSRGITCVVWDNGVFTGKSDGYGLFNRIAGTWKYPEIIDAMMKYS